MVKFRRLNLLVALTLVSSLLLTACGSSSPTTTTNEKKPKQIVMARSEDSDNLDPVNQDGNVNIWMFNLVMEGLVKTDDEGKKVVPYLAEKWDVSPDGLTYTFHLKKDIKFSDGTPVKGEDWVFSLKRERDTKSSPWKFALEAVKDVTAPDDNTVVITLTQPWGPILADLAMFNVTVTSKAYYEKVGAEGYSQKPIGTGPFYIAEWKKGEYILFKKNPYYWQPGLPKADEVKVVVIPDDNTRIMQLQSGTIDIATFVPWNRMKELASDPNLTAIGLPSTETRYGVLNTTKAPFNNIKVRQALNYATDKDAMVKTILNGFGEKAVSFMPKSGMYWNDKLPGYPYDVDKAKQLLKEAGYSDGLKINIIVRAGNTVDQQMATVLKEQWSKVGITLNIDTMESATATQKFKSFQYDIALRAWTNDMIDPSQQADYTINYNNIKSFYTGWKSDEAIAASEEAKKITDENKRRDLYFRIQEIHTNETPMINFFHVPYPVAMSKKVTGFVQTPLGNYRFENLDKK